MVLAADKRLLKLITLFHQMLTQTSIRFSAQYLPYRWRRSLGYGYWWHGAPALGVGNVALAVVMLVRHLF